MVRYEVDLGKLTQRDVTWDAASNTLGVRLPRVEADQPQIDLAAIRQYGSGGVLMTLTSAEADLDAANRKEGQAELLRQARARDDQDRARRYPGCRRAQLRDAAARGGDRREGEGDVCRRGQRRAVGYVALDR